MATCALAATVGPDAGTSSGLTPPSASDVTGDECNARSEKTRGAVACPLSAVSALEVEVQHRAPPVELSQVEAPLLHAPTTWDSTVTRTVDTEQQHVQTHEEQDGEMDPQVEALDSTLEYFFNGDLPPPGWHL